MLERAVLAGNQRFRLADRSELCLTLLLPSPEKGWWACVWRSPFGPAMFLQSSLEGGRENQAAPHQRPEITVGLGN